MLASRLQTFLEAMYRLDRQAAVEDFHIAREHFEELTGRAAGSRRETLLVHEVDGEVDLALYLDTEVLEAAAAFEGSPRPGAELLDAFCVATEGVSHFVYLTFSWGGQERPVSQVELELQAEIDKYLVLRVMEGPPLTDLVARLYDRFRLAAHLEPDERERYTVANRAGRRYARWLDRQFSRGRGAHALDDARPLYRKPLAAKLEHIARAA